MSLPWIGSVAGQPPLSAGDMAAAAGANVWAVLADEDPVDNEADKSR
jgi:hypothetical protein